jgi:hypothetical protein
VVEVVRECVGSGGEVLGDEEGDAAAAGGINFRVPLIATTTDFTVWVSEMARIEILSCARKFLRGLDLRFMPQIFMHPICIGAIYA